MNYSTPQYISSTFGDGSFGSVLVGRSWSAGSEYRYGFNGKEQDGEIYGDNNSTDFGARIYDCRLGRWLSVDPLQKNYQSFSPYNYCINNPLFFIDPNGKGVIPNEDFKNSNYYPVLNYLISNNSSFNNLLGKYITSDNFNYSLGTDDTKISQGSGGNTSYTFRTESNEIISATATSDYRSTRGDLSISLWHYYIVIHEATHAAEALNTNATDLIPGDHNRFIAIIDQTILTFEELNTDLKLNLTSYEIQVLAYTGTEESIEFKSFLRKRAEKSGLSYKEEFDKFSTTRDKLLDFNNLKPIPTDNEQEGSPEEPIEKKDE